MRRLFPLIATLALLGVIAWFAMHSMGGRTQSTWYVVAARDIPAYTAIERDQITLRELPKGTAAPPTAISESSGPTGHAALDIVIGKASATPIRANSLIRSDSIRPFDELQNDHGSMVLIARSTILPHHPLLASEFHATFKETRNLKPGVVLGKVGQHPEEILEQFPSPWSNKTIREGQMLQLTDMDFNNDKKTQTAGTINLDTVIPVMDRADFINRLSHTGGAIPLGIDNPKEISRIAGNMGNIDLYIAPSVYGADNGILVYKKVLHNESLGMTANLTKQVKDVAATQQAQNQAMMDAAPQQSGSGNNNNAAPSTPYVPVETIMKTVDDNRPIFWIRTQADIATRANALRMAGAQFIAVPAGKTLSDNNIGIATLCDPDGNTCYVNTPSPQSNTTSIPNNTTNSPQNTNQHQNPQNIRAPRANVPSPRN